MEFDSEKYQKLWYQIIKQKIANQSRVLSILGLPGAEQIGTYIENINMSDIDRFESTAANITYLTGDPDNQEKIVGTNCHVMV